jgi:hypothetical protein
VPNDEPAIATEDGGVIVKSGIIYDQNGAATGQMAAAPVQSWRGNTYQTGSVKQILSNALNKARTLWAQLGGGPSRNNAAGRPWYFKLVWQNNCSSSPWPCGFVLYPDNPQYKPELAADAASQATAIKTAALATLEKAFDKFPVDMKEGAPNTGDHRVNVIDGSDVAHPCGRSDNIPGKTVSEVFYLASMERAQWALPILLNTAQDVQNALGRADLMKAIGAGVGNNAAHELAHQFLLSSSGMDDTSKNTYNGRDCDGDTAPWVYGIGAIGWETVTNGVLQKALGAGWHK